MKDPIFTSLLNKQGLILRTVLGTPNKFGEQREDFSEVEVIRLALQALREKFTLEKFGFKYTVDMVAYTEVVNIKEGDILEVDEIRYLVVGIEDESGVGHHLKVFLTKL